ncbi:MAG TPA: pitrilysin family protein [Verrucomicrobiota bacterium]|nr:pitrilysin family protein [Verrucomicrobiota bacterium]
MNAVDRFVLASGLCLLLAAARCEAAEGLHLPPYQRVKLDNGLTLLLMEHHEVPLVSFSVTVRAGAVLDPAGKEGLAALAAGLLRKGTAGRSGEQFSAELDFMGGEFDAGAGHDQAFVTAEFMKKDLARGLDLLADALMRPTFPGPEVEKLRAQTLDGIKSAKDSAREVIGEYFNAYLYGTHPYGRPSNGDENSLKAITREEIVQFHRAHWVPGQVLLAAVGDFTVDDLRRALTEAFGGWAGAAATPATVPALGRVAGRRLLLVDKPDATQTFFQAGNVGVARTEPDRVAVDIINTLFGGRFTSMLNSELRIKSGLTYGARSSFAKRLAPGPFVISSYTANASTERAMDLMLAVLKRLHEEGPTDAELTSAKSYVKGQYPTRIETADQLAGLLTELEFHGLDAAEIDTLFERIDALTLTEARRVIRDHFPLDSLVFTWIGKAEAVEGLAKKYASQVDRKSITDPGF